jgi:diguanylate cyclase (GGDEF)-like protein
VTTGLLFVAIGAVGLLFYSEYRWRSKYRKYQNNLNTALKLISSLKAEAKATRQEVAQCDRENKFLTQCLVEFPQFVTQLHSQVEPRLVPTLLLKGVRRIFHPQKALILLSRRKAESEPGREKRFVVAAVAGYDNILEQGVEIGMDEGEIGFVALTQRVMTRKDFQTLDATTRNEIDKTRLRGFNPHLISPMVFDGETVGVIALSGLQEQSNTGKTVIRLISQLGAVSVQNVLVYDSVKRSADIDGLTGIFCKRYMHTTLGLMAFQAGQTLSQLSVFLFDIDNFKNYNDTNGHDAGDKLLQMLTKLVGENTRKSNILGRVGGEEFLIIFPGTNKSQALKAAEAVREKISKYNFPFAEKQPLGSVTISGGVACFPEDSLDSAELLRKADQALYRAKAAGRNRVFSTKQNNIGEDAFEPSNDFEDTLLKKRLSVELKMNKSI